MAVVTEIIPVKVKTMILKKVFDNDLSQIADFGQLYVLFIDESTDTFKMAVPTYHGVKPIDDSNISQFDALQQATYRSSFINVTNNWNNIEDDMFAVVVDAESREVLQMTQLTNFNVDCTEYFYQHLDSKNCDYPLKSRQKRYVSYLRLLTKWYVQKEYIAFFVTKFIK